MRDFTPTELDVLKEYYYGLTDTEITSKARKYGKEIIDGSATYLDSDNKYSIIRLRQWVSKILNMIGDYDPEDEYSYNPDAEHLLGLFPNIDDYQSCAYDITKYLIISDLEIFKKHIELGNQHYIDEAVRLEWFEILPNTVTDVFLF